MVRVLVVDDSALVRRLLAWLLDSHPDITVVDCAVDAQDARAKIKALNPDVITLDIEMPGMDGITFLEKIMTLRPTPVVMISTLTQHGAEASLRSLQLGAFDVFAKPIKNLKEELERYQEQLHNLIIAAASANVDALALRARMTLGRARQLEAQRSCSQRIVIADRMIAVGASTGGTEAICQLVAAMPADCPPILVTQHLPEAFSASFTNRLDRAGAMTAKLAAAGEPILHGHVYVAPGDLHLSVGRGKGGWVCGLSNSEPVNRHRPAVDVLFNSIAECVQHRAVGCLLTGMGKDGAAGLLNMKQSGAKTIAQDEASSVVWGMPGAAVGLGAADQIMALDKIPNTLLEAVKRCC